MGLAACTGDGSDGPSTGIDNGKPNHDADNVKAWKKEQEKLNQRQSALNGQKNTKQTELNHKNQELALSNNKVADLNAINDKNVNDYNAQANKVADLEQQLQAELDPAKKPLLEQELAESQKELLALEKTKEASLSDLNLAKDEQKLAQSEVDLLGSELDRINQDLAQLSLQQQETNNKVKLAENIYEEKTYNFYRTDGRFEEVISYRLDGKNYKGRGDATKLSNMNKGMNRLAYEAVIKKDYFSGGETTEQKGNMYVYNQEYSAIVADNLQTSKVIRDKHNSWVYDSELIAMNQLTAGRNSITGLGTTRDQVARMGSGSATYRGDAYAIDPVNGYLQKGQLQYTINFANEKTGYGYGNIKGIGNDVTLERSRGWEFGGNDKVKGGGLVLTGAASSVDFRGKADYTVGVFGPDANEIAGAVHDIRNKPDQDIIFGGKRK